jgi:hypothetical protein
MSNTWLSETSVPDATTAIFLGPIPQEVIERECKEYPKGVLWITSPETNEGMNERIANLKVIHWSFPTETIREAVREILLSEYNHQPEVKIGKDSEGDSSNLYSDILGLIVAETDSTLRSRKSREDTGYQRQYQIFKNLSGYLGRRVPDEWREFANASLAVVVGAGPSLDQTLPLLKEGFPKPVVVATDSSLRALRASGIDPDFVVSIDPEKTYDSCSENDYTPGLAILSSQSHVSWKEKWGNRSRFLSGRVLTEDWLAEKGIAKTKLQAVNNAGLSALLFADFLGPSAILMVGMDLAGGGQGEERYAESTGRGHIQIQTAQYHKVPGNFEPVVPTPFLSDWKETSDLIKKISPRRMIINLNDRGARLEGATVIHPRDIEDLRKTISENLKPSEPASSEILEKRRALQGNGMNQLLTLLAARCDQIWENFPEEDYNSMINYLKKLLADRDIASLLGDFAFTVLPKIAPDPIIEEPELKQALNQLKDLVWRLEDAILECDPNEDFLSRFLTQKFS